MADVPLVTIVNGLPTGGTGTVMTISNIVAALPTALGAGGGLKIDGSGTAVPVTGTMTAVTTVGTITNVVHVDDNSGALTVDNAGTFAVQAAQSGTWTVQPGNTANTTAWKVDGSAVTQPVSLASVPSHAVTNAGTFAVQAASTLAAETTKVIGTVNLSAAQTLATVTNLATIASVAPAFGDGVKGATVLRTTLATDSAGIITVGTAGTASSQVVTMQGIASMTPILATTTPAASEVHVGEVGGKTVVFPVTMSPDTSIFASGDVIADTQIMDGFFRKADGTGIIQSLVVVDQDDQKAAIDIYFLSANVTLGTENSAPSISDANAIEILGKVAVATTDYKDLGGVSVAFFTGLSICAKAASGTDDMYVGIINGTGTPTYTSAGIKLRVGGLLD